MNLETAQTMLKNPVIVKMVTDLVEALIEGQTGHRPQLGAFVTTLMPRRREVAFCKLCNKALTDPRSIKAGYGPECARQVVSRLGW